MEGGFSKLVIDAVFPRFCVGCEKEGVLFCERCEYFYQDIEVKSHCVFCSRIGSDKTCTHCSEYTFLDGLSFIGGYNNSVLRNLIINWKYYGDRSAEQFIKKIFIKSLNRFSVPTLPFYSTHVPLHCGKKRERGFDQAKVVSSWVDQICGITSLDLLVRHCASKQQGGSGVKRCMLGELDGIFRIDSNTDFIPENILICDDVFTTGATMDAAARCLKEVGVQTVWGFVLAKG